MPSGYTLQQRGAEVQEAINKIMDLGPATSSSPGTMSADDKTKLDSMDDWDPMSNMEIQEVLNLIF